jgi:hypothetical protein
MDESGWTIELPSPLSAAQVQLWEEAAPRPVRVNALEPAAGSSYGLRFVPDGWAARAGHTYTVAVRGVENPFAYQVRLVDCGGP